jgi:hypothetical protein
MSPVTADANNHISAYAYDANLMRRYPVSRKLNNSKIDGAEAASPVTLDIPTQAKLF